MLNIYRSNAAGIAKKLPKLEAPLQAPTTGLEAFRAQQLPPRAPPTRLAEHIDENLQMLRILADEMRQFERKLQALATVRIAVCWLPAGGGSIAWSPLGKLMQTCLPLGAGRDHCLGAGCHRGTWHTTR